VLYNSILDVELGLISYSSKIDNKSNRIKELEITHSLETTQGNWDCEAGWSKYIVNY
jgi:hypothetical protein